MASLFLPPSVARELLDERAQFTQCLLNACHTDLICEQWNRELERIDPLTRMVKAPEVLVIGMPLEPGYYHLVRFNETTFPSVTPVRGPDGEFRVPDSGLLEHLRSMDLQNGQVVAAHKLAQRRAQEQAARDHANHGEARRNEIYERWLSVSRTQISMNRDSGPWAQNHAGFKRTRARPAAAAAGSSA